MGRLSTFTPEIAAQIIESVSEGDSRREAARKAGVLESTVRSWLADDENKEFAAQYARAVQERAQYFFERGNEIAMAIKDGEGAQIARVQLDWLKWVACKLGPRQFGDKLAHTGADGAGPVSLVVKHIGSDGE